MPRFTVPVVRLGYSQKDFEVEADSQETANTVALERAPKEEFSEHASEYKLAAKHEHQVWIVCHRRFDHGQVALVAFSEKEKAYRHANRIIAGEVDELAGLDNGVGPQLVMALREERYEDAVRLFHRIRGNSDSIDVVCAELDQHDRDEPICVSAIVV